MSNYKNEVEEIKNLIGGNENSVEMQKVSHICNLYSTETILEALTPNQKDLICDYVEINIDYGYGQYLDDNLISLYHSLIDERKMQINHIEGDDNSITEHNKEGNNETVENDEPDICDDD